MKKAAWLAAGLTLAGAAHGAELARCCHGYERDAALRQELQQELHLALWQSLSTFRGDCSLRTWV